MKHSNDLAKLRLSLGTAALGMPYGIANPTTGMNGPKATRILDTAWRLGVHTIDTAPGYGSAEERIGSWIKQTGHRPELISKLSPVPAATSNIVQTTYTSIEQSAAALGVTSIDGYLTHNADDFVRREVLDALLMAKSNRLLRRIGISAYEPEQVFAALETGHLDLVQLPLNLVDRRMLTSGAIAACKSQGVIVHARSIFLQGVLLMNGSELPHHVRSLQPIINWLQRVSSGMDCSVPSLLLRFVLSRNDIDVAVVGVYTEEQLVEHIHAAHSDITLGDDQLSIIDEMISDLRMQTIDPRTWST